MKRFSRITGTGSYLPPRRVTNAELVARLAQQGIESSDHWIRERTGIRARHFAEQGVYASDLGVEAARNALSAAGVRPDEIDLIIVATSTPDMVFPPPRRSCSTNSGLPVARRSTSRRCAVVLSMRWSWPTP
jgi:3-oxoacyl-[acyl-carrier-protein] synthase-3